MFISSSNQTLVSLASRVVLFPNKVGKYLHWGIGLDSSIWASSLRWMNIFMVGRKKKNSTVASYSGEGLTFSATFGCWGILQCDFGTQFCLHITYLDSLLRAWSFLEKSVQYVLFGLSQVWHVDMQEKIIQTDNTVNPK